MVSADFSFFIILTGLSVLGSINGAKVTCRDDQGNPVPWYFVYKLPKLIANLDIPNIDEGLGYYFIDDNFMEWTKSEKSINVSSSMIGRTLADLYGNSREDNEVAFVAYNDHAPGQPKTRTQGHTKGVLVTNRDAGFWLVHSVPQFPIIPSDAYEYQPEEVLRAQIFHCLNLKASQIDDIADIFKLTRPNIYSSQIPTSLEPILPKMFKFLHKPNNEYSSSIPQHKIFELQVPDFPSSIQVFAKPPKFHEEVFSDWIATSLKSGLIVQSWLGRPDRLPSKCGQSLYPVYNVNVTDFDQTNFSTLRDHSKWTMTLNSSFDPWTCISDLNRRVNQRLRGGITLCVPSKKIWKAFQTIVLHKENCSTILNTT